MDARTRGLLARAALFAATVVWGSSFFIIKDTMATIPPATLLAFRFSVGSAVLGAAFWKRLRRISRVDFMRGLVIGLILGAAALVQNVGLTETTPGKNAFLTTTYCVIVPFMYWAIRKEFPGVKRFLAAGLCLAGIALVSLTETLTIGRGDVLTLVSGALYAAQIVAIALLGTRLEPLALTVTQFIGAALLTGGWALAFETRVPFTALLSPQMLYLSLVGTLGAYFLQVFGQRDTPPAAASIILSLESVFGVLFSVLFYGEETSPRLLLGFAVLFIAVLVSEWPSRKDKAAL